MVIICIRHGKPEFQYPHGSQVMTAASFNALLDAYDEAGLDPEWNRSRLDGDALEGYSVSSDLRRAQETALLMTGRAADETSSLYREVPLPRFARVERRMSGRWFMTISRLAWFLGTMPCEEPRAASLRRVEKAADELVALSSKKRDVLLFAHGFFLWLLGRALRRRGWRTRKRGPYRYLEQARFERDG